MNKSNLEELRLLVRNELNRRIQINNLLKSQEVLEYLSLTNTPVCDLDYHDIDKIIKDVLNSYDFKKITKTNGIYVCTESFKTECTISYQDTEFYHKYLPIDSDETEQRIYNDIESGLAIRKSKEDNGIKEFERDNIVLNPYNSHDYLNGYHDVRDDFFIESIRKGQSQARKLVLKKYNRL